jgi:hypothetical protein
VWTISVRFWFTASALLGSFLTVFRADPLERPIFLSGRSLYLADRFIWPFALSGRSLYLADRFIWPIAVSCRLLCLADRFDLIAQARS